MTNSDLFRIPNSDKIESGIRVGILIGDSDLLDGWILGNFIHQNSGIVILRDSRMLHPRQGGAFGLETSDQIFLVPTGVKQLERYFFLRVKVRLQTVE